MNKEFFLKLIREWKFSWMNQTQNSQEDYQNYFERAFRIDSNMIHSLANRLEDAVEKQVKSMDENLTVEELLKKLDDAKYHTVSIEHDWNRAKVIFTGCKACSLGARIIMAMDLVNDQT